MVLFVWIGCGSALSAQALVALNPNTGNTNSNAFLIAVSTAFGFAITVLAYTIAPISGGHINPAVTAALMSVGQIDAVSGFLYMVVQFLGALVGAGLLYGTFDSNTLQGQSDAPAFLLGSNSVNPNMPVGSAFLGEVMGTFILVWTVMLTAVSKKSIAGNLAPIAIGWSVLLAHLVLIPITGCGINPARTFGPHVVVAMTGSGDRIGVEGWWVFYTAPFVGALLAAAIAKFLFDVTREEETEKANNEEPASVSATKEVEVQPAVTSDDSKDDVKEGPQE